MYEHEELTGRIIGLAIDVHRVLGPGLLESVYEACLCRDLKRAGIGFQRQVAMPVIYRGEALPLGFRADIVVENTVIIEIKAVAAITAEHEAQILTYLRVSHMPIGLLMNFHALRLVDGLRRFVA
jgi:GxxExxY protein